jgi:hypothetical protein
MVTVNMIRDKFFEKALAFNLKATSFHHQGLVFSDIVRFLLTLRSVSCANVRGSYLARG